jgi:UV DNA damage endonuclease
VRLGFPEKVLGEGGLPERDGRRAQGRPHLRVSLERVAAIFDYLDRHDLRMYRLSQGLAPYASHPGLPQFHGQVEACAAELAALGERSRELDLRLSMHTGPFVVLSSAREEVLAASVAELSWQAALLDAMGLGPEAVLVVHVGSGGAGAGERFLRGVERLPEHARARIAVENDDRLAPLVDVVALARAIGRPVVFDVMHHAINDPHGVPEAEALRTALATWPAGVVPKIHFSSPRTAMGEEDVARRRWPKLVAHADLVDPLAFEAFLAGPAAGLELDVMLEARLKDLAVLHLRAVLSGRPDPRRRPGPV